MKTIIRYLKNCNFEYLFLIIWIICLPIMSNKYLQSVSLFQKIQFSDLSFLLIFFAILIKTIRSKIKLDLTYLWFPLTLLLFSFLVSSFKSTNLKVSFSETFIFVYLIVIYLTVVNIIKNKTILYFVLEMWILVSSIIALLGIIGIILTCFNLDNPFVRFYPSFLDKKYRLISTFFLPNMAYSYFHIGFFLSLGMLINEKTKIKKVIYLFATLVLITAIFFTFSRGWISFLAGLGFLFYFIKPKNGLRLRFISYMLFFIVFIMFILFQLFISYTTDMRISFKSGYDDYYKVNHLDESKNHLFKEDSFFEIGRPYNRLDIAVTFLPGVFWYLRKVALNLWQQHPLFGVGPGMFNSSITKLQKSNVINIPKNFREFNPHSTYFGTLAEKGIFGLIALFILYFYFLKNSMRVFKKTQESHFQNLILCCSSALVGLMVFAIHVDIMNFRWLWFLLGLSTAIINISQQESKAEGKI